MGVLELNYIIWLKNIFIYYLCLFVNTDCPIQGSSQRTIFSFIIYACLGIQTVQYKDLHKEQSSSIMALGSSLSSILELNLNETFNKEIKVLAASIQSKKTIFTQFLGAEDLSTEGLLLRRID